MPRLSNKNSNNNMVKCKKHPKHRQSPGVCSLCLADKLSKVSATSITASRDPYAASRARAYYCSSSSLSSSDDDESSYPSSSASPMHEEEGRKDRHTRILSDVNNMKKFSSNSSNKSMKDQENVIKKKVVGGFWSKFLLGKRNDDNLKNVHNNVDNNKVYMSQPFAASSSSMVVC